VANGNAAGSAAGTGELDYLAVIEGQLAELREAEEAEEKETETVKCSMSLREAIQSSMISP
jgi:hypothetical protein